MGTKGFYAFIYKGKRYVIYNYYDSYPEALGNDLLNELRKRNLEEWKVLLEKCIMIDSIERYDTYFSECDAKIKYDLVKHFDDSLLHSVLFKGAKSDEENILKFSKNKNIDEIVQKMDYNDIFHYYGRACSMEKVLTSGFLFTSSGDPTGCMSESYMPYDSEYGYIIDFDKNQFIYKDLHEYYDYTFHLKRLPKSIVRHEFND
jgi:hypothetical protein